MPEFNHLKLSITGQNGFGLFKFKQKKNVDDLNTSVIVPCMVNSFWCSQCVEFVLSYFTGIRSILFKETTN